MKSHVVRFELYLNEIKNEAVALLKHALSRAAVEVGADGTGEGRWVGCFSIGAQGCQWLSS